MVALIGSLVLRWVADRDEASRELAPLPSGVETTASPATPPPESPVELFAVSVEASSEYKELHASHLTDGDLDSYWNDASLAGVDASLSFRFADPVTVTSIEFHNVRDPERFARNYRIRDVVITLDSGDPVAGTLEDKIGAQPVAVPAGGETVTVTITVTTTYPAQTFEGRAPFEELALAEVRFYGAATR